MGAFLSGLFSAVGPRLEEKHKQEMELQTQRKQGEYNTYWNSMQAAATRLSALKQKGDNLTPEEERDAQGLASQYAWSEQQLNKLTKSNKPLAEAMQKVGGLVKHMLTRPSPSGTLKAPSDPGAHGADLLGNAKNAFPGELRRRPQPTDGQPSQQTTADQPTQANRLQPPAPMQPSMQGAMALANPEAQKQADMERERARRQDMVKGLNLSDRERVEFQESGKMPAAPPVPKSEVVKNVVREGDEYKGKTFTRITHPDKSEEWIEEAPKGMSGRPTIIASDYVTLDNAKTLAASGVPYLNEEGKPIDLEQVPKGMVLQAIHVPGKGTVYQVRDINDKVVKFNNQVVAVAPAEVHNIPQGAGTVLGQANVPTKTVREVPAVDAQGNPIAQKLETVRTPQTGPVSGNRPSATTAQPQQNSAPPAVAPAAKPSAGNAPNAPAASAAPSAQGTRPLPGMTSGQFNKMLDRITPVREAATQLFGDPSQPDVKGLSDFAKLADNPESRKRLGTALKLTFDSFKQASGESGIHAGAGPVSLNASGGVIQLIENAFGVPPKLAEQSAQIMQKALSSLTPEEREAYNATMSAFGTIVGLRSLTRASAAQASVATIEREMPVIGVNTTDSKQFYDQMQRLAEIVYNGTKGVPESMWEQTPGFLGRIKELPSKMKQRKDGKPSPNGTLQGPASKVKVWNPQTRKFEDQ